MTTALRNQNGSDIITAAEAADLLRVGRSTLTRLMESGVVKPLDPPNPFIKRPRAYRFSRREIEQLIETAEREARKQ